MSAAESDLLFPLDSLMLADLADYDDFSADTFLLNEEDGFTLVENFDGKSGLKPLLVTDLNEFGSLAGIKEEDEEEEKAGYVAPCSLDGEDAERRSQHQAVPIAGVGSINESMHVDSMNYGHEPTKISNGDSCMSLEDSIAESSTVQVWHASPFKQIPSIVSDFSESSITVGESCSSLTLPAHSDIQFSQAKDIRVTDMGGTSPLPCSLITTTSNGRLVERRPAATPSVFNINSPLSSPTSSINTPERCSMFKVLGHDESGITHQVNSSKVVQPGLVDTASLPMRGDVHHKALSHSILQEQPPFATMQRSQSSHALGQFGLSGQQSASTEEYRIPSIQMSAIGYACHNNFPHYQPSCAFGLPERSSTPMRRVFSTGDIQASHGMQTFYGDNHVSHLERVNSEENLGLKVGHYTLEERKRRVHRYRQKRNERNFSKKIKYACRKTLADSRPRIRGRFARMLDDAGEPLVKDNEDDFEEGVTPTLHCVPHGHMVSFWNAAGINATIQHGH